MNPDPDNSVPDDHGKTDKGKLLSATSEFILAVLDNKNETVEIFCSVLHPAGLSGRFTLFCWQPARIVFFSHTKSAPTTSHQQYFSLTEISTSHQPAEQSD